MECVGQKVYGRIIFKDRLGAPERDEMGKSTGVKKVKQKVIGGGGVD